MSANRHLTDPLGVLGSTRRVVDHARSVTIRESVLNDVARRLFDLSAEPFIWRQPPHWWAAEEPTAMYVLVTDTLNFCFWGEPRWRVRFAGEVYNGYWALAAALRLAIERGEPLLDASWQRDVTADQLAVALNGEGPIPLLEARAMNLRELGTALTDRWGGSALNLVAEGQGSTTKLVELIVQHLSSYRDVATYAGEEVRFYKRAQILAGDLFGAFEGQGPGALTGLASLTAFADYKVPQVLRELDVLSYSTDLDHRIQQRIELAPGSPEEVEIRAATIWGVELLRQSFQRRGREIRALELDWLLWTLGQSMEFRHPYHLTRTIYY